MTRAYADYGKGLGDAPMVGMGYGTPYAGPAPGAGGPGNCHPCPSESIATFMPPGDPPGKDQEDGVTWSGDWCTSCKYLSTIVRSPRENTSTFGWFGCRITLVVTSRSNLLDETDGQSLGRRYECPYINTPVSPGVWEYYSSCYGSGCVQPIVYTLVRMTCKYPPAAAA